MSVGRCHWLYRPTVRVLWRLQPGPAPIRSRKGVPGKFENVTEWDQLGRWRPFTHLGRSDAEILFRGSEPLPVGKRAVALLRVLVERVGVPA